jgi:hypothetical protein
MYLKQNIAVNVLFSNDKLLVGESDYYYLKFY